MTSTAHTGVAATSKFVVVGDRGFEDQTDIFRCFDATTGELKWQVQYPALGELDYGNSPRATPLIHGDLVFLFGALGDLHAVRLDTGLIVWSKNIRLDFGATKELVWGTCGSPLIVEGRLIVSPGAPEATLAALDPKTGEVQWQTPGAEAGYGSLIAAKLGGKMQIVGHDRTTLGGWDLKTGRRLWSLTPPVANDFNVPTPIEVDGKLLVTTENNGTRLYEFKPDGTIVPEPVAENEDLAPDTSTPIVVGRRVFGCWGDLFCLDLENQLRPIWMQRDLVFDKYAALIGNEERVLVVTLSGQGVLLSATGDRYQEISRVNLFADESESYAHPALVGTRIYVRSATELRCLDLETPEQ